MATRNLAGEVVWNTRLFPQWEPGRPVLLLMNSLTNGLGIKLPAATGVISGLNEGFASYGEAIYAGATSGTSGYTATMNAFMTRARNASGTLYVQDISNVDNIFNSNRTYAKGASVLHMLRGILGDDVFFRAMKAYANAPNLVYATAVTEDFQAVVEQVAGKKLDYFFKEWVYGESYPTYQVSWQDNSGTNKPGIQVRLQQSVKTTTPASFTMPVQMKVQSAAGDTLVTVFNDQANQTFTLPAKGKPTGVVVDPNNLILKAIASTTMIVTAIEELTSPTLTVFPNPATDNLNIRFTSLKSGVASIHLYNTLGAYVIQYNAIPVKAGDQTLVMPLQGTPPGRYVLALETPGSKQSVGVLIK